MAAHSSPDLTRWVDELPRPAVAEPSGRKEGHPHYEIEMQAVEQRLHRDLPPTTVFGYDGLYPGPTIEARQGEPIFVRWKNALPERHILPVDTTIKAQKAPHDGSGVWAVTHLHGGNVPPESDGQDEMWYTPGYEETGPKFDGKDYLYPNDQPAATLWYHDHAPGITRLNVYAGLAGLYLLRSDTEAELGLPDGEYEIPLVFQDRRFEEDGSLFYPSTTNDPTDDLPDPTIVRQFYGDTSVVNGKVWPRLSVEPRKYRLRLLNGANSRYYRLKLLEYDEATGETGGDGPAFVGIGNDGGLLSEPVRVERRLEFGPGQRFDVVVDFSEYAGETLLLHNDAPAPYLGSGRGDELSLPEVLLVDVSSAAVTDDSRVPDTLVDTPEIDAAEAVRERHLALTSRSDEHGRMFHLLGSDGDPSGHRMSDPITERVNSGDVEIWSFDNRTGMSHPMHLHVVHFQVLGRQSTAAYDPDTAGIDVSELEPPRAFERGWNDTISVDPGEVVHVAVPFGEYDGKFEDHTGRYMWHCHMLEHEDYDMMRPFEIVDNAGTDGS
ncbi:MAG: multicopper oxidase domain-containing protein [Natronomonas sp.]